MRVLLCVLLATLPCLAQAPIPATGRAHSPQTQGRPLSARAQERIQREVLHELNMLTNYRIFDILRFQVRDSTVILSGKAHSLGLKRDAEDAVRHIEGVEKVQNDIQVLNNSPFDDRLRVQIARTLFDTPGLMKYSMGAVPSIHIIVDKAHVTLEGVVDNQTDKNLAGIRAQAVPGILGFTNNLIVEK